MRHALKRIDLKWQDFSDRIREGIWTGVMRLAGLDRRQRLALGALGVALILGSSWVSPVGAQEAFFNIGGAVGSYVILMLSTVVMAVCVLGMVIAILLVKLLIAVATYNDFVNAAAVTTGWPLIRDVVNMFFIVVLLIIAFSTIIGYKEFDYKKHVPRLLLMAVLINFSKTLVGLLIDFSQVIMLTFVNGFKEAAFGNFVKMFGLDGVMSIVKQEGGTGMENLADSIAMLISLLFGVTMLSVVCVIVLIMLIYLTARIIAIWVLLIFSPMAFFVWALPPKLAKSLSRFSGLWWEQLSAWLTGGPIMAFFLWLTMAIVASSDKAFATVMPSDPEMSYASKLLNRAAKPEQLANFVVATALLFMGVKEAVQQSKSASESLGKLAKSIKESGGPIGGGLKLAGRAAGATVKAGGKVAGKGLAFGAKSLDTKYGFSKAFGKGLSGVGEQMGKLGKEGSLLRTLGTAGGKAVQDRAAAFTTMDSQRLKGAKEDLSKRTAGQPREQQIQAENVMTGSNDVNEKKAGNAAKLSRLLDPKDRKAATGARQKELTAHYMKKEGGGREQAEAERLAFAQANSEYDREVASQLDTIQNDPVLSADAELMDKVKAARKDNPGLGGDLGKIAAGVKEQTLDHLPAAAYRNLDVGMEALKAAEIVQGGAVVPDFGQKIRDIKNLSASQRDAMMATAAALQTTQGQAALRANASGQTSGMTLGLESGGGFAMMTQNGQIVEERGGGRQQVQQAIQSAAGNRMDAAQAQQLASRLPSNLNETQAGAVTRAVGVGAYAPGAASYTPDQARAMGQVQISGVPTSPSFGIDRGGNYESAAYQQAHVTETAARIGDLGSGDADAKGAAVRYITTIDTSIISTQGQAADTIVSAVQNNLPAIATSAPDAPILAAIQKEAEQAAVRAAAGQAKALDAKITAVAQQIAQNKVAAAGARHSGGSESGAREIDFG